MIQTIYSMFNILKGHYLILKNLEVKFIKISIRFKKREIKNILALIKEIFNFKILRLLVRNV